jgi:hypothetical protein
MALEFEGKGNMKLDNGQKLEKIWNYPQGMKDFGH